MGHSDTAVLMEKPMRTWIILHRAELEQCLVNTMYSYTPNSDEKLNTESCSLN